MTEREKELLRMCVIYAIANLSDVVEAFESDEVGVLSVDGEVVDEPSQDELGWLMKTLQ